MCIQLDASNYLLQGTVERVILLKGEIGSQDRSPRAVESNLTLVNLTHLHFNMKLKVASGQLRQCISIGLI